MRKKLIALAVIATLAALVIPAASSAQSAEARIANALAAAPPSIGRNAAVMDWPDKNGKMATLREGSNGWTCLPSEPKSKYIKNDAFCGDANFMDLMGALMANKPPVLKGVGYSYMLTTDDWESNTVPMAKAPTADNQWHHLGPHVMVVYPNTAMLAGLPTRPSKMGPYVMWSGTPYAHVMWPVK